MWFVVIGIMILFSAAGLVYLISRFRRFLWVKKLAAGSKKQEWLIASIPVAVLFIAALFSPIAAVVAILHLIVFWLLSDLIGWLVKRLRKKDVRRYYQGICAIAFTVVYLAFGWYFAHHVYQTDYRFQTDKSLGQDSLRIVLLADSHLGEMMSGEIFAEQLERIEATNPDLVVIAGDFVDDDTSKQDMLYACNALGELETRYGVYYIFGNHDKGYFRGRDFDTAALRSALEENGVTILEDEALLINNSFYLIGRQDRSEPSRASIAQLTSELEPSKYTVVLNHQPNDYDNEEAAEVDLVLSGHTHGGHIFPAGVLGLMMGANDQVYGAQTRGSTNFVVTSGIAGWGVPFKTGCISEFVVIDITGE